jgi:hypothetical protein
MKMDEEKHDLGKVIGKIAIDFSRIVAPIGMRTQALDIAAKKQVGESIGAFKIPAGMFSPFAGPRPNDPFQVEMQELEVRAFKAAVIHDAVALANRPTKRVSFAIERRVERKLRKMKITPQLMRLYWLLRPPLRLKDNF